LRGAGPASIAGAPAVAAARAVAAASEALPAITAAFVVGGPIDASPDASTEADRAWRQPSSAMIPANAMNTTIRMVLRSIAGEYELSAKESNSRQKTS
jgi:hypothetical protein